MLAAVRGAATWPLVAGAQQPERMRRIGVLMGWSESDPQFRSWIDTFVEGLAAASWMGTVELAIVAAVGLGLWLRAHLISAQWIRQYTLFSTCANGAICN